jgi:hypothetical protein
MKVNKLETEQKVQETVIKWLLLQYPHALYCASAGGMRTSQGTAIKMKRAGYVKGFPDLFIYEPRGKYHGLAIELKREKGGQVSPEQNEWRNALESRGYCAYICRGFEEAREKIEWYLMQ